jgi:hypothetical protein
MSEPTPDQVKKDYALLDEFVRQVATQAALLAGLLLQFSQQYRWNLHPIVEASLL